MGNKNAYPNHLYDCPACGQKKRTRANDLVCPSCYKAYAEEAGRALANGQVVGLPDWVAERGETLLLVLEDQCTEKQSAFEKLQEAVSNEAYEQIKKATGGKFVDREVFKTALAQKRKEIWAAKGGHKLFAELKTAEALVGFIKGVLKQLADNKKNREQAHPLPDQIIPTGDSQNDVPAADTIVST